jgi:chromosome segregation ATPase
LDEFRKKKEELLKEIDQATYLNDKEKEKQDVIRYKLATLESTKVVIGRSNRHLKTTLREQQHNLKQILHGVTIDMRVSYEKEKDRYTHNKELANKLLQKMKSEQDSMNSQIEKLKQKKAQLETKVQENNELIVRSQLTLIDLEKQKEELQRAYDTGLETFRKKVEDHKKELRSRMEAESKRKQFELELIMNAARSPTGEVIDLEDLQSLDLREKGLKYVCTH